MVKEMKKTSLGLLPNDWDVDILEHRLKIQTGSRNTEDKQENGKYPFFVRSSKIEHIDTYHYDCEAILTAGDGVGTGKVFHYINGKFDAHQRVYILTEFEGIKGKYFYYYFRENFLKEVSKYTAKSSVDSVRRDMIAKMTVPIPKIEEQAAIAEALSDIDSLISSLQKLIEKKRAIKQGAMQELLTGEKRLPGFCGAWKKKYLCDLAADIKTGTKNNEDKVKGGKYPFFVRSATVEKINSYGYDCEAILVPGEGNIGEIFHYINGKFDCHQRVYKISDFRECIGLYIFYYLKMFFGAYALLNTVKATVDSLRLPTFQNFIVHVPSDLKEQQAIAQVLSDMDSEIEQLEKKLAKYQQIKQGMMQELLTGRIRLMGTDRGNISEV